MAERILLVEDEKSLNSVLAYNLQREGYEVDCAFDGEEALILFEEKPFDLVLLDIMLPKLSGLDVCRLIRGRSLVPILLLTAKSEESDKIHGLDLGADDYLTKPFAMGELMARARALLRRSGAGRKVVELAGLHIDRESFQVEKAGRLLALSRKEFLLLWELASRAGAVVPSAMLLRRVWGEDFFGEEQTLQVHIHRLREKIEDDPSHPAMIQTVRGVGYRMTA